MRAVTVRIASVQGSAPRDPGTEMVVTASGQEGTIGGGALEFRAIEMARGGLDHVSSWEERVALGPEIGQCCGGAVTLLFTPGTRIAEADERPVWIYGAGHVGQALARVLAPLPGVAVTVVDPRTDWLARLPENVTPLLAAEPAVAAARAPETTAHFIMSHDHGIDLALCDRLLRQTVGSIGLIGSATKWARFRKRLAALGHSPAQIEGIACPIGDPSLGKAPEAIAIGVAARLLSPQVRVAPMGEAAE